MGSELTVGDNIKIKQTGCVEVVESILMPITHTVESLNWLSVGKFVYIKVVGKTQLYNGSEVTRW